MIYKVSTTGSVSEIVLHDMGARTLTHPTVELDLGLEYTDDELLDSDDLALAIESGELTLVEESGGVVTEEYVDDAISTVSGTITDEWLNKDSAVIQLRRTTSFTPSTTWQDYSFNALDVESDSDIIEWDTNNTERLLIKLDGLYEISYSFPVVVVTATTEVYARVLKNNSTQLDGSYTSQNLYQNETHQQDRTFRVMLSAGDYIALQIQIGAANITIDGNAIISVAKLDGVAGPAGPQGPAGQDGQDGVLTVSGTADYFYGYDGAGTTQLATSYTDIPLTEGYATSTFTHSGAEVTIEQDNTFIIIGRFTVSQTSSNRSEAGARLVVDQGAGYTEVPGTLGYCYSRNSSQDKSTATVMATLDLEKGDKLKLQAINVSGGGTLFGEQNGSGLQIFTTKGQTGPQGPTGPQGTDGADGADGQDGTNAGGPLAVVQARRTTLLSDVPTSWTDLTFDTTDIENDSSVIEHDDINTDRILIKESGLYKLEVRFTVDDEGQSRIRVNDSTVIPGSTQQTGDPNDVNDIMSMMATTVVYPLTANDYVTVQVQSATDAENIQTGAIFLVYKMEGAKGADGLPGPAGSGTTINLKDEGSSVTNTPHSVINFTGTAVTVTDAGSGEATVNVDADSGISLEDEGSAVTGGPHNTLNFVGEDVAVTNAGGNKATVTLTKPVFGTEYATDGDESETTTTSTSGSEKASLDITSVPAGTYRFGWYYEWRRNTTGNDYRATIELDSTTTIMLHSEESQDSNSWHPASGFIHVTLTSGNHSFTFEHYGESSNNTSYTRRLRMEIWRVL